MATGLLSAELAATCNALGFYDGNKYHLEPHSKETTRDIIRYLRRDEQTHDIRRFLGNTKILQTDLLPILQCHSKEKELFDLILRLIVNLSSPAIIVYNEILPTEKSELNQYLQIVSHLQSYKEAFGDHKSWSPLSEQLSLLLNKDIDSRDDDDQRTIERILVLIRNILHVPSDALSEGRPDNDASTHDQVVWALHQSGMLDLLLYMASSSQECAFFMHLLEIICLLVREQPPSLLAQTAAQRSVDEKHRDEEELLKLRQKELQLRQTKTRQYLGSRHSNFGGTFVIKNMKSTSDKDVIYHKPLHKVNNFSLDIEKKKVRIPKNRLPLKCGNVERKSALSVRLILKQFCVEILNAAYNPLMRHIKDSLSRGKSQDNDESYYFTGMKFFMEFNRSYKFQVKLVSETMAVETFHFVQKYLETWYEMMTTDKKRIPLWSARMHLTLKAYKELLQNLAVMDISPDQSVRESSKVIKSNIFYVVEYRELLLILFNTFKKFRYSHQYLIDLIETTHIFLKLICKFCQDKKLIVQKQVKQHKKHNKKKRKQKKKSNISEASEELWPQLYPSVEKVLSSPITKEVFPYDPISDKSLEEQKIDAMKRIQLLLKSGDFEEAIAFLRTSREIWPENDCFGNLNMSKEEELDCLKEVFLADLDLTGIPEKITENASEDEEEENGEEEFDLYPAITEQTLNVMDVIKRYVSPRVMGVCITLLSTYQTNTPFTNHCIAKMLHRIAWDCKLPSMLFQASLFRKFQEILQLKDPAYKELAGLAVYTIRKFIEVAAVNKKVFMELLLFKSSKEAYEIECGYGIPAQNDTSNPLVWEEHEEEELRRLHSEYLETNPSEDMLDWIMEHLIKQRSKKFVKKKVLALGLYIPVKNKKGLTTSWTEEQKVELKNIYNELKDIGGDVINEIMAKIKPPRTRNNIIKTLVTLGLAESSKDFAKSKKTGEKKKKQKRDSSSERSESSEDDENNVIKTKEEIRANQHIPNLYRTVKVIFSEKQINSYMTNGLEWLESCIEDCLEDIDDEQTEVPLLPLSNESILSIENLSFKDFLSSLGVFRPLQQEIYWRFPEIWKENDFKCRKKLLKLVIENESFDDCSEDLKVLIREISGKEMYNSSDESESEPPKSSNNLKKFSCNSDSDSSNSDSEMKIIKQKLIRKKKIATTPKSLKKNKRDIEADIDKWSTENIEDASTEDFNKLVTEQCRVLLDKGGVNLNQEDDKDSNSATVKLGTRLELEGKTDKKIKKRSKLLIDSDSEDNEEVTAEAVAEQYTESPLNKIEQLSSSRARLDSDDDDRLIKKKKPNRVVESDSDDEQFQSENTLTPKDKSVTSGNKNNFEINAVSTSKRSRISDSEDETPTPRQTKKKAIILSDDED
uniref:Timeless-m n=1 Tax=Pyrrhocoris apterus TaxID=37000 RepID=A0A8K1ZRI8_PYRAP|nr:timeless-m [Pyrrhocoris apterus]